LGLSEGWKIVILVKASEDFRLEGLGGDFGVGLGLVLPGLEPKFEAGEGEEDLESGNDFDINLGKGLECFLMVAGLLWGMAVVRCSESGFSFFLDLKYPGCRGGFSVEESRFLGGEACFRGRPGPVFGGLPGPLGFLGGEEF
jgi:hypothetical protein